MTPKAIGKKRSEKFQEILDELTPKVTGDNKSEVISGLKQLKGVFTDTIDSLVLVSSESETKRKSNLDLEKDNLILKSDNKSLKEKSEESESDVEKKNVILADENKILKDNADKYDKHNKTEFIKKLSVAVKHPSWKNVEDKFSSLKLKEAMDKDGKIDPEKITKEMITDNEIRLTDLGDAGLFGKVSKSETPDKNTVTDEGDGPVEIKSREDLTKTLSDGLAEVA